MTKYILNSGGIRNHADLKRQFHQEIVTGLGNNPKFVLCNFAQGREYWESKFPAYSNSIKEDMPDELVPDFKLAMPDKFIEQCFSADVIYFHGGDDTLLKYLMSQFNLNDLFRDKVIATNSASSDMLSKSYWTCDSRQCGDGLGIVPIKFVPHYMSDYGNDDPRGPIDWQKAYDDLENYGDKSLPIHALKEGEFIVVEQ